MSTNRASYKIPVDSSLNLLYTQNGIGPEDVSWIKIDVEGAELEVLNGAADILSKSKDITVLIEVHTLEWLSL